MLPHQRRLKSETQNISDHFRHRHETNAEMSGKHCFGKDIIHFLQLPSTILLLKNPLFHFKMTPKPDGGHFMFGPKKGKLLHLLFFSRDCGFEICVIIFFFQRWCIFLSWLNKKDLSLFIEVAYKCSKRIDLRQRNESQYTIFFQEYWDIFEVLLLLMVNKC